VVEQQDAQDNFYCMRFVARNGRFVDHSGLWKLSRAFFVKFVKSMPKISPSHVRRSQNQVFYRT